MRALMFLLYLMPLAALAEGFALSDLREVRIDPSEFAGGSYDHQQDRTRLLIACDSCADLTFVNAELGRADDKTEARLRAGVDVLAEREAACRKTDAACTVTALDMAGAVGWVSQYRLGANEGSTAVLMRDGDMLTIRSLSESRNRSGTNMAAALRHIAPQIVGGE